MGLRPFLVLLFKFLVFVYDASLRADAGHRADDRVINCAHRIEARVARSRGDSVEIFKKIVESIHFYKIVSFLEYGILVRCLTKCFSKFLDVSRSTLILEYT